MKTFNKETAIKLITSIMSSFEYDSITTNSNERRVSVDLSSKSSDGSREKEEICIRICAEDLSVNLKYNMYLESSIVTMWSIRIINNGELINSGMLTDNVKIPKGFVDDMLSILNEE